MKNISTRHSLFCDQLGGEDVLLCVLVEVCDGGVHLQRVRAGDGVLAAIISAAAPENSSSISFNELNQNFFPIVSPEEADDLADVELLQGLVLHGDAAKVGGQVDAYKARLQVLLILQSSLIITTRC